MRFSNLVSLSYKTLRDHWFTVTEGTVTRAKRLEQGGHIGWRITVQADSNAAVTVALPVLRLDRDVHGLGNFQVHVDDTGSAATSYVDRDVAPETRYVYRSRRATRRG